LTEPDIQQLPEPVKRYIRYTGSVGKPKVNNIKITFTGKIRNKEKSEWMPFTSEQYNCKDLKQQRPIKQLILFSPIIPEHININKKNNSIE
jgi:hypothetical protein